MDFGMEQKVRLRAYEKWMAAGMIDGLADEHWFTAERSVLDEAATAQFDILDAQTVDTAAVDAIKTKPAKVKVAKKTVVAEAPKVPAADVKVVKAKGTTKADDAKSAGTKAKSGSAVGMAKRGPIGSISASA